MEQTETGEQLEKNLQRLKVEKGIDKINIKGGIKHFCVRRTDFKKSYSVDNQFPNSKFSRWQGL